MKKLNLKESAQYLRDNGYEDVDDRQMYYWFENGNINAHKLGRTWYTTEPDLRAFCGECTSADDALPMWNNASLSPLGGMQVMLRGELGERIVNIETNAESKYQYLWINYDGVVLTTLSESDKWYASAEDLPVYFVGKLVGRVRLDTIVDDYITDDDIEMYEGD